jgi:hypothetical protein
MWTFDTALIRTVQFPDHRGYLPTIKILRNTDYFHVFLKIQLQI